MVDVGDDGDIADLFWVVHAVRVCLNEEFDFQIFLKVAILKSLWMVI